MAEAIDLLISCADTFGNVSAVLTIPARRSRKRPWFNCLEDYAFFTEHLVDSNGVENMTAELAAVYWDQKR